MKIGGFRESDQYPIISDWPITVFRTVFKPDLHIRRPSLSRRRHAMPPSKFAVKFWTYAPALRAGSIGLGYSFD